LVIGFIEHLQIVTTSNCNTLANSCPCLLTTAHTKSSQIVFTSRFLVTDPNSTLCLRPYWLANLSQLTKLYDWLFNANQFDLVASSLILTTSNFIFQLNTCGYSPYVAPSLTRGRVCRLQLLLVLASAVILRFESHRTCDHILPSQIRDSPNLEGQVPVFMSPRNRVAQSFSGSSPARLTTTFYRLRFETLPTWRFRFPYLCPPGTGWPGYTPRH
jgi:hypothetical protein